MHDDAWLLALDDDLAGLRGRLRGDQDLVLLRDRGSIALSTRRVGVVDLRTLLHVLLEGLQLPGFHRLESLILSHGLFEGGSIRFVYALPITCNIRSEHSVDRYLLDGFRSIVVLAAAVPIKNRSMHTSSCCEQPDS